MPMDFGGSIIPHDATSLKFIYIGVTEQQSRSGRLECLFCAECSMSVALREALMAARTVHLAAFAAYQAHRPTETFTKTLSVFGNPISRWAYPSAAARSPASTWTACGSVIVTCPSRPIMRRALMIVTPITSPLAS
jgi:hypothetical protein